MIKKFLVTTVMTLGLAVAFSGYASAVTVGFERITNNSVADASAQLSVDITDGGDGALLDFTVSAGPNPGANIAEIYFDDGPPVLFDPPPVVVSQIGASFEVGNNSPGELPSANNATPPFNTTSGLEAEADGNNATGVTVGDTLILKLIYAGAADFNSVLAALDSGAFRIGLHVRSLLNGQSDSFVNTPPQVVPVPAAAWLFLTALGGLGFAGWRRRRATA